MEIANIDLRAEPCSVASAAPQVGSERTSERTMTLDAQVTATMVQGGRVQQTRMLTTRTDAWTEKIQETAADAVTRIEVDYTVADKTQLRRGEPVDTTDAVVGSWRIAGSDDGLQVVSTGGEAPTADQLERIEKEFRWVGSPSSLAIICGDLTPGQRIPLSSDAGRDLFSVMDNPSLQDAALTYVGVGELAGRAVAGFDLSGSLVGEPTPGLRLTTALSGRVYVDRGTSERAGLLVDGALEIAGSRGAGRRELQMQGAGTLHIQWWTGKA